MTQEEKQLLLQDLCARLPHGVKANIPLVDGDERIYTVSFNDMKDFVKGYINIKPYLRTMSTMSSMTEEESREWFQALKGSELAHFYDFVNSHHFDYRGLIPMGLAIEAPKDMYNTKTEYLLNCPI